MSVLPTGRWLARFLNDPRAYLQAGLVIGPRRRYGPVALFAVPGVALLVSCISEDRGTIARLALGVGLTMVGWFWLLWPQLTRGHSLVLLPDGVEVRYRDTVVWCPWALFNAEGLPVIPDADSPPAGMTLPVAADAIAFVELRQNESIISYGAEVCSRQWQFTGRDEVVLPARYEVRADHLGNLLLQLGRRLGRELPRGAPRAAASRATLDEVRTTLDAGDWLTAPLSQLAFPPVCCGCGHATDAQMRRLVWARGDWLALLSEGEGLPVLSIPVCDGCQVREFQDLLHSLRLGAALGFLAALGCYLILWKTTGGNPGFWTLVGSIVCVLAGILLGASRRPRPPVELSRYLPSRGTVAVRFRNPDYMALLLETMHARAERN